MSKNKFDDLIYNRNSKKKNTLDPKTFEAIKNIVIKAKNI